MTERYRVELLEVRLEGAWAHRWVEVSAASPMEAAELALEEGAHHGMLPPVRARVYAGPEHGEPLAEVVRADYSAAAAVWSATMAECPDRASRSHDTRPCPAVSATRLWEALTLSGVALPPELGHSDGRLTIGGRPATMADVWRLLVLGRPSTPRRAPR